MAPPSDRDAKRAIQPLYFGSPERQLLGLHHPATLAPGARPQGALLICQPHGHEYIQFHRVCRLLAVLLAEAGFHVLRFDFAGCGDSAGEEDRWGVASWTEDARLAARELKRLAGTDRIGAVGLRLGGTIATQLGMELAGEEALEGLVLWDPVHDGKAFLAELGRLQGDMLRYAHVKPRKGSTPEVLGFPLPQAFAAELAAIDGSRLKRPPAKRVLVIESHDGAPQAAMCDGLKQAGAEFEHQSFSNPHLWVWTEDFAKVHVPRRILDAIVAWAGGVGSGEVQA